MLCVLLIGFSLVFVASSQYYRIDDKEGAGPRFDGIGGLSGGGVRSISLFTYSCNYIVHTYLHRPPPGYYLAMMKLVLI